MANQKIWLVKFVAGNPKFFDKVITVNNKALRRSEALDTAEVYAKNNWRSWVEHHENPENRIYESPVEVKHRESINP